MEEDDDFCDWIACRRVNELFYEKAPGIGICVLCATRTNLIRQPYESTFWAMTACWGGHSQESSVSHLEDRPCICNKCDIYFVLNIVKGSQACLKEGCRRAIRLSPTLSQALASGGSDVTEEV